MKGGGENYPRFPSEFGGHGLRVWGSWSVIVLGCRREVLFGSVGRPVGKTAASSPRGATQTPQVCTELKLVWFGDFKIQSWVLCFGIPGASLASVSPIHQ